MLNSFEADVDFLPSKTWMLTICQQRHITLTRKILHLGGYEKKFIQPP